jgi:hypothetical protein
MAITREKSTGAVTPVTVSRNGERGREISGRREMTGGFHLSARGREEQGTVSGLISWAAGCFSFWAEAFPRGPFLFLFLLFSFLFCFLYSFIHFSNLIQFDSNQLREVSKIQNNHPDQ